MKKQELISLLNQLTLEEKIGQMNQKIIGENIFSTGPNESQKNKQVYNIGSVLNSASTKNVKEIQDEYLQNSRLKIPLLFMNDIINGYKTIFPCPLAQGCSWNIKKIKKVAEISKKESIYSGINVTFSPMVDLSRDGRWGRCLETIGGEDPYLASVYAKTIIEENQKGNKLASCVKHFAAYGASEAGRDYNTVDMSKRELLEYYMKGYKTAIDNGVKMIMTSFNIINGIPATVNKWLLSDLLRKEWGFEGVIISDYNAIQECINHGIAKDEREAALKAIQAGVDIDMMSNCYSNNLKQLVEENMVSIEQIDKAVLRILNLKNELGLFENPYGNSNVDLEKKYIFSNENLKEATKVTEECCVLLKNKNNILPLNSKSKIALIGPYANNRKINSSWTIYGNQEDNKTLKEIFEEKLRKNKFIYSRGCEVLEQKDLQNLIKIQNDDIRIKNEEIYINENIMESVKIAKSSDIIILAIGEHYLQSGEACSRSNLEIPQIQLKLLEELSKLNKPIIAVLFNGRPLQLNNIEDKVDGILEVWMPGTKGAEAIFNILYGKTNPSGKLTMSFPQNAGQCPIYYNHYNTGRPNTKEYRYESRYLDIPTESFYPFGYGLSYSKFVYSNLTLSSKIVSEDSNIIVTVNVKNESNYAGKEIIQLYIQDLVSSVVRPIKELKAFKKVYFKPYEEKTITFEITNDMLKFYNEHLDYIVEVGEFKIYIGSNSVDTIEDTFEYVNKMN